MIFAINSLDKTNVHFGYKKTNSANKAQFLKNHMELKDTVSFSSRYDKKETPDDNDPWVTTFTDPSDDDRSRDWLGHIREDKNNYNKEAVLDIYGHNRSYNTNNQDYMYEEEDDD